MHYRRLAGRSMDFASIASAGSYTRKAFEFLFLDLQLLRVTLNHWLQQALAAESLKLVQQARFGVFSHGIESQSLVACDS